MIQRSGCIVLAIVPLCGTAGPAAAATLVYAAPCPGPAGRPTRIVLSDTRMGVRVHFERAGDAPLDTPDANFARISRRLFFTIKTASGLIEFQGHAGVERLTGRLTDDAGATRSITMPLAGSSVDTPCSRGGVR